MLSDILIIICLIIKFNNKTVEIVFKQMDNAIIPIRNHIAFKEM